MLSRGKSRRLEKRFASLDADLNRRLGIFAIAALLVMALLVLLPQRLGSPEWLARALGVVYGIGIAPTFALFYSRSAKKLSCHHGLECARCGHALRKLSVREVLLRRPRFDDPDYCVDGEVPERCPHCQAGIEVALEQRSVNG